MNARALYRQTLENWRNRHGLRSRQVNSKRTEFIHAHCERECVPLCTERVLCRMCGQKLPRIHCFADYSRVRANVAARFGYSRRCDGFCWVNKRSYLPLIKGISGYANVVAGRLNIDFFTRLPSRTVSVVLAAVCVIHSGALCLVRFCRFFAVLSQHFQFGL